MKFLKLHSGAGLVLVNAQDVSDVASLEAGGSRVYLRGQVAKYWDVHETVEEILALLENVVP